jgi:transposase InsO family protein
MEPDHVASSPHQRWAELRFSIVGALLAAPAEPGELALRIKALSETTWRHPSTGKPIRFGRSTIERWYYRARQKQANPVGALRTKSRADQGMTRSMNEAVKSWLSENYRQHPSWSRKLHTDNLRAWLEMYQGELPAPEMPSYASVVRFMKRRGFWKLARPRSPYSPGQQKARARLEAREVRRFEVEYVGGLWHLDFHHSSRQIVHTDGKRVTPLCLCVLDDHSRLACHVQWYLHEDTKTLVHGFTQALQKRGLPRSLMSDNGSAMKSDEFTAGLLRLGITQDLTLPYSPYQNGKQESFWGNLEGRLMAMLEGEKDLSLTRLNQLTQIWIEKEYNLAIHSETESAPLERFIHGKDVLRPAPDAVTLKLAFRQDVTRLPRRSDGTFSLLGKRFEIPTAFRTLTKVFVRFAEWDLSQVHLIDPKTQASLAQVYPVDLKRNAEGKRRIFEKQIDLPLIEHKRSESPLLTKLIAEYSATGLPPAYIPMPEEEV